MADSRIPAEAIFRAASSFLPPMDWATSVLVALANDRGNIYNTPEKLATIWCPATASTPNREMKSAMKVNEVTSMK